MQVQHSAASLAAAARPIGTFDAAYAPKGRSAEVCSANTIPCWDARSSRRCPSPRRSPPVEYRQTGYGELLEITLFSSDESVPSSRCVVGVSYRRRAGFRTSSVVFYCVDFISVLLGRETSSTLCAVSAPATGRPFESSSPSWTSTLA